MAHTLVFANQKGGVGKTTSVANIGAALADRGRRVLLVDLDSQSNLSEAFGVGDPDLPGLRVEDVLELAEVKDLAAAIWTTREIPRPGGGEGDTDVVPLAGGVHIIPCTDGLADVAYDLQQTAGSERRLADALAVVDGDYDYILIDTPPSIGPLVTLALVAGDHVVVPAKPADADIGGAIKMADLVELDMPDMNPDLRMLGVLITHSDRRWNLSSESIAALAKADIPYFTVQIPHQVRVGSSPRFASPLSIREPDGRVGRAYVRVAGLLDKTLHSKAAA